MIGLNCPNAIKLKQVIRSRSSDPYAIYTLLGWGIISPVTGSTNREDLDVSCHRVAVKEIGSKELPSHGFVVETLVKEIISPEAVKRMFQQDFSAVKHMAQQTLSMDISVVMKECFNLLTPVLTNIVNTSLSTGSLRSSCKEYLVVPRSRLKTYGDRAFSIAGPKLWNDLPLEIRKCASVATFKQSLKTFLFKLAYRL